MAELVQLKRAIRSRGEDSDSSRELIDTHSSAVDAQSSIVDPPSSILNLRSSLLDPRSSGKQYWRSLEELAETEENCCIGNSRKMRPSGMIRSAGASFSS